MFFQPLQLTVKRYKWNRYSDNEALTVQIALTMLRYLSDGETVFGLDELHAVVESLPDEDIPSEFVVLGLRAAGFTVKISKEMTPKWEEAFTPHHIKRRVTVEEKHGRHGDRNGLRRHSAFYQYNPNAEIDTPWGTITGTKRAAALRRNAESNKLVRVAGDAIRCFFSDAMAYASNDDFWGFVNEFGYELCKKESREKARRAWKGCKKAYDRLVDMFGLYEFEALADSPLMRG